MISALSKLSKRQPIQELAFHKEQWEINGVPFQCHESYYEGELLNGVDLKVKAVKGLSNRDHTYDYLQDSQQLVFAASSHLMIYNTHKRAYHQLFPLDGEVSLLRTHLQKMNNRQYILWVENFPSEDDAKAKGKQLRGKAHSRVAKRTGSINNTRNNQKRNTKNFIKSIFSLNPDLNGTITEGFSSQAYSKMTQQGRELEQSCSVLKVFDYTRKELVFEGILHSQAGHSLKQLFLFWNHYKIVGYVTEDYESDTRFVFYKNIQNKSKSLADPLFGVQNEAVFSCVQTSKNISSLLYNSELNHLIFPHGRTLNVIVIREDEDAEHELFRQFLNLSDNRNRPTESKSKTVRLHIEERAQFEGQVLSLALNDQYLAVLTSRKIYFHSAFDITSLIFEHAFEQLGLQPLNIEFNKSSLMLTHRNSASVFTFTVKNKMLKLVSQTVLEITHCKEITKIYTNSISSEIFCVVLFYELQSKDSFAASLNSNFTTHVLEGLVQYAMKPAFVDIVASFLAPAGNNTQAALLGISRKRFKRVHTCPWISAYVVETQEAVELGRWRQSFENKKCVAVHPNGIFLVVCLKECFKVFAVTQEGFVNSYRGDAVKDIQACAISPQGNHLAVCSPNCIFIYDFYSCSRMRAISLPFGIVIEALQYSGHSLVCYLRSKKVYLYDSLNEYRESFVFNPKSYLGETLTTRDQEGMASQLLTMTVSEIVTMVTFSSIYYCPLLNFFIYSYKSTVYFFNCTSQSVHAAIELQPLSCIHYCSNLATLFLGTDNGEVICFPWPNKPTNLQNEQRRFKLHAGRVADIKITSDLRELITIGEDESLCVCSLVFVQNLKRFEGLELIEHLSGGIRICYDFLSRRGVCQYTHNKFNDKNDHLKDCQDEVLNANFILPQERQKQKEQMFTNVKVNMRQLAQGNKEVYQTINYSTNQARDLVSKVRHEVYDFSRRAEREKEDLKQAMYAEYIQYYNKSEASQKELQQLTHKNIADLAFIKQQLEIELKKSVDQNKKNYESLVQEQSTQMQNWKQDDKAELNEIDREKQEFIESQVSALDGVIGEINNNNGVLACKNNNLEKEITDLRRKMEEHRYLLYRLQNNTSKLKEQQERYEVIKADNKRLVQKQDRINLTEIEKRYVKLTQTLIERDKEINIQLVNHQKEKNILIHLEKVLEGLQGSIQTLVGNILQEKKDRKEELQRIEATKQQARTLMAQMIARKKQKISMRNQFNNYLCRLQGIIVDIVHIRDRKNIITLLQERQLIDKEAPTQHEARIQEKEILNKILSNKVQTLGGETGRPTGKLKLFRNGKNNNNSSSMRVLKTEANDNFIPAVPFSQRREYLAATYREAIEKKSKDVYMKLDSEQKHYERIKTQQLVFQNTRKKFNLENQDLIENYNSLAMDNKKIMAALRRQESLTRMPARRERSLKGDGSPTPFQLYLQNKANLNSQRAFVPLNTYQG